MVKEKVRLDRALAFIGFASRQKVKQMIKDELVLVNQSHVKSNSYIKDKDIISVSDEEYITTFQVNLTFEGNKIMLGVTPLSKERVKVYTC